MEVGQSIAMDFVYCIKRLLLSCFFLCRGSDMNESDNKKWYIYKHTNKKNSKVYIGQTKNIENRWRGNGVTYKHSVKFYNAVLKYGFCGFEHEILMECQTQEDANYWEIYYIKEYDSVNCGYNLTLGGCQYEISEELREKERILQSKRKVICIETQQRYRSCAEAKRMFKIHSVSEVCNGKQCTAGGFHWAWLDEYELGINPIRESGCGNNKRKVICLDTNIIYNSIEDAKIKTGAKGLLRACNGKGMFAGGYRWAYYDDYLSGEYINKQKTKNDKFRKVRCFETQCIFENISVASKTMGIYASHISSCCVGKRKTTGGYHWEYID